jgi:4-amino-4-deoxy-L-arabinose transferase-like glycosyltransferase
MTAPGPRRTILRSPRDLAVAAAVVALLALFWWLTVSAARGKSPTSDELPHLTAGFAYDKFGDFRMQPENGNLPQRLFGLPGLAADARFTLDESLWRRSTYWQLSWDYFYALDNPTDRLVHQARALNALLGVALGLLIFFLTRAAFGPTGGLLSLAFYALAPNTLAQAGLATSDMAAALFLTLAAWLFWRHLEKRDLPSGLLAGLASGLALVAKFNGVLIAPICAVLVVADAFLRSSEIENRQSKIFRRCAQNLALALLSALAAWIVIWAFFNFRFTARGPGTPVFESFAWSWAEMFPTLGWKRGLVEFALAHHLFPEAWLYGLTNVLAGEAARPNFFAGEHAVHGTWLFFPTLVLTKTTLAMLGALLVATLAGALLARRAKPATRRTIFLTTLPLAVTATVVWLIALRSNLNIGDRHILPVYPALFLALGLLAKRRALLLTALVFLAAHAAASFAIRPHYLAGFNALAGGPAHAHHLFVDSSLDWGQDLPALRDTLTQLRAPGEKFYLGYFGSAWPPHYGVRPDAFLPTPTYLVRPPLVPYDYAPGLYAISATVLSEVYTPYRGPWTPALEQRWQTLRAAPTPETYPEYDRLRFARLCKILQLRAPHATPGYSILVDRLTPADLRAALEGPVTGAYRLRPR